jgi:hypothetical protein
LDQVNDHHVHRLLYNATALIIGLSRIIALFGQPQGGTDRHQGLYPITYRLRHCIRMNWHAVESPDLLIWHVRFVSRHYPLETCTGQSSIMAAAKVYIDQLFKRKLGRPLWDPDLCEVYVGDVGYFDQKDNRNFRRLFNVLVDVDDALNKRGVPEGFQPLEIDPELNVTYGPQVWTPGYCLMTSTVTASDAAFKPITLVLSASWCIWSPQH